jgi:hypothetical protein
VVVGDVALGDPLGKGLGQRWDLRQVLPAGRHHDRAGGDLAVGRRQDVPVARGCQPREFHPVAHRAVGGEVLEPLDDLGGGGIGVPWLLPEQPVHPAGRVQPERVPALGAPGVADPRPLQDKVFDTALGEGDAGREPGRPGAHHGAVQ